MKSRDRTDQKLIRPVPAARTDARRPPTLRPVPVSVRTAVLAAGSLGLLTSVVPPAMALGLGELTVESRLGQPFSARILVRTAYDETVEPGCVAVLAGTSGTGLPGIPKARVEVEPRDGAYILRIRTQRPVLEPAVSLVLSADCPGAAPVRREYTVLVDPPDAVWAARLPTQAASPAPGPSVPRVRPTQPSPAEVPGPTERAVAVSSTKPRPPAFDPNAAGMRTVRVQRGDTLYGIVARLYPESSRRDRWRLVEAIVAANRNVFPEGDPNRLPLGAEIRVPDAVPATPATTELASAPARPRVQGPASTELRILTADEEEKLRAPGSPLATGPVTREPAVSTVAAPPTPDVSRPSATATPTAGEAASPERPETSPGPLITELNEQLASAQSRIRELSEKIARLDAQLTDSRPAAVVVPTPPLVAAEPAPPAPTATPTPEESVFDASRWYPLGLLAIAGIPLAYLLGRSGRRRTETADDTLSLTVPTRSEPRSASRPPPTAPILVPSEPSTSARPAPQPASGPATPPAGTRAPVPEPASAPSPAAGPGAATPAATGHLDDAHGPVHRLLLEAELHLLFDQREEARYVLEQAVDADSDERPDLRPWTMLFDLLRVTEDRESFDRYTARFQGRYNVAPPLWDRPAAAEASGGLAERFPHVLDRIIELWGTREGMRMLNGLLLDDRGGSRRGFDFEIGEEISFLRDLLDRRGIDPIPAGPGPDDRWSTTTLNLAQ